MNHQLNPARNSNYICNITGVTTLNLSNQSANVPTINLSSVEFDNKNAYNKFYVASNKLNYEPLVLEFLVSEDHREWIECYEWMFFAAKSAVIEAYQRDVELTVYNAQSRIVVSYIYHNCIPTVLTGMRYATKEDDNTIFSDITLNFERLTVVLPNGKRINQEYIKNKLVEHGADK